MLKSPAKISLTEQFSLPVISLFPCRILRPVHDILKFRIYFIYNTTGYLFLIYNIASHNLIFYNAFNIK